MKSKSLPFGADFFLQSTRHFKFYLDKKTVEVKVYVL